MRDMPLIALANILHRSGLYNDAIIAANSALEISPSLVVTHFTLANIYASMKDFEKAKQFYIVSMPYILRCWIKLHTFYIDEIV